jgi:hypothetical protein
MATLVAIGLAVAAVTAGPSSARQAGAAATRFIHETGRLHRTSSHGFLVNEQGSASGTIDGTIYIHLHVVATNRVTAEVNIYPRSGSLSGYAEADYRVQGATATFSGSLSIRRGTGTYAHAHGSGLSFTGTIQRSDDATTVSLRGSISD